MVNIKKYLELIDAPNKEGCERMCTYFVEKCPEATGSSHNHQYWVDGYFDHIKEIFDYADILYRSMSEHRALPFTLSDVILVLFLHDIEKPIKYGSKINFLEQSGSQIREMLMREYDIKLNKYQSLALKYIHGEGNDYQSGKRIMNELSAFCHCCDIISARIYYNYPKK